MKSPDVFYFGNIVGETADVAGGPSVSRRDMYETRRAASRRPAPVASRFDHNRDGVVNVLDYVISARNAGHELDPPAWPVVVPATAPAPTRRAPPPRRTLLQ
jgi:hypothetical protein